MTDSQKRPIEVHVHLHENGSGSTRRVETTDKTSCPVEYVPRSFVLPRMLERFRGLSPYSLELYK